MRMKIFEILHNTVMEAKIFWDLTGKVEYVDDWFLMGSPVPILLIILGYLLFVLKLGPECMKNKQAINLNNVLTFYNLAQIGLSYYLCHLGTKIIVPNGLIHYSCLLEDDDSRFEITSSIYVYFFAKLTELLDTVFFVLKKNYRQITFLHVYHHVIMLCFAWLVLKYEPTYNTIFFGTINSYVHVIMYTYYCLSAFPGLAKYLWWKKHITKIQIMQFIIVIIQLAATYCFSGCPLSYTLLITILLNAFLFIILFINFYVSSYKTSNRKLEE